MWTEEEQRTECEGHSGNFGEEKCDVYTVRRLFVKSASVRTESSVIYYIYTDLCYCTYTVKHHELM